MAGARDAFPYQITDMPLLSTFYEPLSQQLISVLDALPRHPGGWDARGEGAL